MFRISPFALRALAAPELTYNIASGTLTGEILGEHVSAQAGSGGRAGTKTAGARNWWLANNPLATHVKLSHDKTRPGGPLPMGRYDVRVHPTKAHWLRLEPHDVAAMQGRDGMAIHGRGPRGSDGCIVPTDFHVVIRLCDLVRRHHKAAGRDVVLEVVAIGQDLDRQNRTA